MSWRFSRLRWSLYTMLYAAAVALISTRPITQERPLWWRVLTNLGHVPAYALLAMSCVWTFRFWLMRWAAATAVAAAFVFGAAMELAQRHITGREPSWSDLGLNSIGIGLGVLMAEVLRRMTPSNMRISIKKRGEV